MSTISASTTTTTAFGVTADTTGTLVFQTGASPTTALTLTSAQNVGIGISAPGQKFQVGGGDFIVSQYNATSILNGSSLLISTSSTTSDGVTLNNSYYGSGGYGPTKFLTGGSETMRLDTSGNLGIGTSSVLSGTKLDVRGVITSGANYGGTFSVYDTTGASRVGYMSSDAYASGNNDTNLSIVADQAGKGIKFYTAGSATVRAFIDSSGNVGVGNSTPSSSGAKLVVTPTNTTGSSSYLTFDCTNFIDSNFQVSITGSASTDKRAVVGTTTNTTLALQTNGTERMRIASGGQVMVGSTTAFASAVFESGACALGMTTGQTGKLITSMQITFAAGTSTKNIRIQLGAGMQYAAEITITGNYNNFNASGAIKYVYAGNVNNTNTTIYGAGQQSIYSLGVTSSYYSFGSQSKPNNTTIYLPITGTSLPATDALTVVIELITGNIGNIANTIDYV